MRPGYVSGYNTPMAVPGTPVLPDVEMNIVRPTAPVTGRVVSTRSCMKGKSASFVRHVAIDVAGTPIAGNFRVGQSFGVTPPGVDANGKPHKVRLYSIASPSFGEDGDGNVLSTTPKRVIDERTPQRDGDDPADHSLFLGVCSNYLCDRREGDEVQVSGPNGRGFLLPEDPSAHDYLFIATGTGIAPFRGMAMELLDHPQGPRDCDIHLVMGAPYRTDLLYDDLFRGYAERTDRFHYHTAISRERHADSDRGLYAHQLVDTRMDDTFGAFLENERTLIYICGLAGMQVGLYQVLARHGFVDRLVTIRDDELAAMAPDEWPRERIKRGVHATKRCMVEVY